MQITFTEIKQVKRLAKQLRSSFPSLKHGQLLNHAAAQLLGVRGYHEAIQHYEKWILQDVQTPPGAEVVSTCLTCDFMFAMDIQEDRQAHQTLHERFHEACSAMGYRPGTLSQREKMKGDGWYLAGHGDTLEKRVTGALQVLRGWYDRSLSNAIEGGYWRKHPSFESYVPIVYHYLSHCYEEVRNTLADRYGATQHGVHSGSVCWYPKDY